jgi:hypothetical protein
VSHGELIRQLLDRLLHTDSDRLGADLAAIDMSFGLLTDVEIELDRTDGARGAHLERITRS